MPKQVHCKHFGDITINEFANAIVKPGSRGRLKKTNLIREEEKLVRLTAVDDITDDGMGNFYNNFDKLAISQQTPDQNGNSDIQYNTFPNDFWYLLSDYIKPEDVCRFALICKQTYAITMTAKFWKNLYKRYHSPLKILPTRLQPECMARPRGLRACCIRSLYYMYEPFEQRLSGQRQQDFHLLAKRYVDRCWFKQEGNNWLYYYKLKRKLVEGSRAAESERLFRQNPNSIKSLRDIFYNPEEGCSLLVIQTTKFHPLPKLSEEMEHESKFLLHSISHLLSRCCKNYRLEMKFSNTSRQVIGSVTYEPAVAITVYDWWTPDYYKPQGFKVNVEYLRDEKDPAPENMASVDDGDWGFANNDRHH